MSEFRKDPVSRRWVIFFTRRFYRPNDFKNDERKDKSNEYLSFALGMKNLGMKF